MTKIKLSKPIELRTKDGALVSTTDELTVRDPVIGDMVDAMDEAGGEGRTGSMSRALACRLTGLTLHDFNHLNIKDGTALLNLVSGFFADGQPTGATR